MYDPHRDQNERSWRKQITREIDRALNEGRRPDPEQLAGGDGSKTAEVEALIEVRAALKQEGIDALGDESPPSDADPLAEVERILADSLELGTPGDVSIIEAEQPALRDQIDELKRFYAFLADALTGDAASIEVRARLPERKLGRFVLERVLYPHPLGRLDAALDEKTRERFALLLLNPSLPKATAMRVLRDASAAKRLNDPGFVPLAEIGSVETGAGEVRYLAYQDVGGASLDDFLRRVAAAPDVDFARAVAEGGRNLPPPPQPGPPPAEPTPADPRRLSAAAGVVRQLAETLHRAHGQGVLQADFRPSNVVLAADGRALLRASNLVGAMRHAWKGAGSHKTFLAPEILEGESNTLDWRADVYGCCAVFYALLTGDAPPADLAVARRTLAPVSDDAATLIVKGLSRTPTERPASCLVLAEACAPWATTAAPASRRRRLALLIVAIAAAVLAATFFALN
ncbi:MAG TPA: hypothetical protein VEI02_09755 [Planctomycetota bacterium]|nr:hypothetical protein [Planctomycetota bacterium]